MIALNLNICSLASKFEQIELLLDDELKLMAEELNLKQLVNKPTRLTKSSNTIIDHIYSNLNNVVGTGVIELNISDHFPTYVIIKKQKVKHKKTFFTCRVMKNYSDQKLGEELERIDWSDFYALETPADCWELMYRKLLVVLNKLCPEKCFNNVKRKKNG